MSEGFILLGVIGLFFLSMYAYAYGTTNYSVWKEEKTRQRKLLEAEKKEQQLKADMLEKQKQRDENYRIANVRSEEIKKELKLLEQLKHQHSKVEA